MIEGFDIDHLEVLVDRYGIVEVLTSLSELCGRKAETVAATNASLAKLWCAIQNEIEMILPKVI